MYHLPIHNSVSDILLLMPVISVVLLISCMYFMMCAYRLLILSNITEKWLFRYEVGKVALEPDLTLPAQ